MFQGTLGAIGDVTLVGGAGIKAARMVTKLEKFLDPVRRWTSPKNLTRESRHLIDRHAMDWTKARLERRGYKVISLTNPSNQGIDYLAIKRLPNGELRYCFVEVKGHWKSDPPKLTRGDQQSRKTFVEERLNNIVNNGDGMWDPAKIHPDILNAARDALAEIQTSGRIHGFVVNVDWSLSWFPGGRNSGVWTWPRDAHNKPWHPEPIDICPEEPTAFDHMHIGFDLSARLRRSRDSFNDASKAWMWDRPREDLSAFLRDKLPKSSGKALVSVSQLAAWSARKGCVAIGDGSQREGWAELKRFFDYEFWSVRARTMTARISAGRFNRGVDSTLKPFHLWLMAATFRELDAASWLGRIIVESRNGQPFGHWTEPSWSPFRCYVCRLCAHSMGDGGFQDDLGPYAEIFARWDQVANLPKAIKAACDYHLQRIDTGEPEEQGEFQLNPHDIFPSEILALYRVREKLGLETPWVNHPLLDTPFTQVPEKITYEPDPLVVQAMDLVTKLLPEALAKR